MNFAWEPLGDGVRRCRLPFLDVTIGLVLGKTASLLIDTGTTLTEARAIAQDILAITGRTVSHIVLTHKHFDHVLGASAFSGAAVYCAPEVAAAMADTDRLRAHAIQYEADADEVERAIAAVRRPDHQVRKTAVDLGDRSVLFDVPGRGHTDHDLIVVVPDSARTIVFCGDLVEESGDPVVDCDSDLTAWPDTLDRVLEIGGPDAIYVPGHGAVVDADFIRRQREWLRARSGSG
jgi:glyoxylase-like metal-dependent hydrolase (beta-lactamase superfamily II)